MIRRSILRKLAALCAAALLLACLGATALGEEVLPISVLIAMQHQTQRTGDFYTPTPDSKFSSLDSVQVDAMYDAMAKYAAPSSSLLVNNAAYFYYYEHLNPASREIYDLIMQVARDPVSEGNIGLMLTDLDPNSDEFEFDFFSARYAVTFDHPELFWLYNGSEANIGYYWYDQRINGRYSVFISMKDPFNDFETQMTAFNMAAENFLAGINRNASQYEIAKQIHDKLIELVTYDTDLSGGGAGSIENLGHTAYGTLVADSWGQRNYAVCDGISLAYEYLLQQCGIPAVFIGGYGGSDLESMGGHAWNMVNIDGFWYETDATWDENVIEESFDTSHPYYNELMEAIHDPTYREKISHYLFLISSDKMEHFVPDDEEWRYYLKDGSGSLRLIGESVHERDGTGLVTDADTPYGGVIYLAPRANFDYGG